ncbi:(p)ppGpp synthetase I, SpoT/RelA(EC:) [Thermobrachium celere DSM 8682]|uniref:(P)ppGpp synthetase I, SpoT/RelA( EC: ) n=1 Tax=Thermobrachium celere DSM 8682 TaxID=941824 RepID=R7RPI2_9CLOT|nr:(p)ppGpp synthetase I, SpoT/RelA(EC:) [Thermobrachium celere DSM 8682]
MSVHRKDCTNFKHLSEVEPNRVIEVNWTGEHTSSFIADIQIQAVDRTGLLADITNTIVNSKVSVKAINARTNRKNTATIQLSLEVLNTEQLEKIMREFRKLTGVIDVYRNRN